MRREIAVVLSFWPSGWGYRAHLDSDITSVKNSLTHSLLSFERSATSYYNTSDSISIHCSASLWVGGYILLASCSVHDP